MDSFNARDFRNALGCFATGITVMTTRDAGGGCVGMTGNSFASVSLDPPLVSFCLDRSAHNLDSFLNATHFAVNVLSEEQEPLSATFARSSVTDKFNGVAYALSEAGCPL